MDTNYAYTYYAYFSLEKVVSASKAYHKKRYYTTEAGLIPSRKESIRK